MKRVIPFSEISFTIELNYYVENRGVVVSLGNVALFSFWLSAYWLSHLYFIAINLHVLF